VNTIGEPCDRKGHARFDGEALVWGRLYGWAIYAPGGNDRDQLARLRMGCTVPVPYPTGYPAYLPAVMSSESSSNLSSWQHILVSPIFLDEHTAKDHIPWLWRLSGSSEVKV